MGLWNQPGTEIVISDSQPSVTPEGTVWYDSSNDVLKTSDGSSFTQVGQTSFSSAAVVSHSTTIGDYSQPSAAVISSNATTFSDSFTSYANTTEGDTAYPTSDTAAMRVNPTNDNIDFDGKRDGTNNKIVHDFQSDLGVGVNLSDSAWIIDFDMTVDAVTRATASPTACYIGVTTVDQASDHLAVQDALALEIIQSTGEDTIGAAGSDGAQLPVGVSGRTTLAFSAATYYVRMIRLSTTSFKVEVFSDSTRTTSLQSHTATVNATIASLRYFFVSNCNDATNANEFNGTIDNIALYNGKIALASSLVDDSTSTVATTTSETNPSCYVDCGGSATNILGVAIYLHSSTTETEIAIRASADTTFTSGENVRTITVSNLTAGAWNYIRFNLVNKRYLQIYGNSGTDKVLSIAEIKYLTKTDAQILQDLGILEISGTDTTIALDGT